MKRWIGVSARLAMAALAAAFVAGCSSSRPQTTSSSDITVFAAASLKSTFTDLGKKLEESNPGTKVTFSFAGSSDLVAQLIQGAPADVFASADTTNMAKALDAGLLTGAPVDFATNTLTIVTAPGNPKHITAFADLAKPGTSVVVCAPQVPCGLAAEKVEKATRVTLAPVSEESSVTDVLGKITAGQADAGLVYVTDAAGARDKVTSVPFLESGGAVNTYPMAVLKLSKNEVGARKFVDLVTGPEGQKVLAAAGFAAP